MAREFGTVYTFKLTKDFKKQSLIRLVQTLSE